MKKYIPISLLILTALAVSQLPSSLPRASAQSNEDYLPIVSEGCRSATAAVKSGAGQVTISIWSKDNDGSIQESEDSYSVEFEGSRYSLSKESVVVKNEPKPGTTAIDPWVFPVGKKTRTKSVFDGQRVTYLESDKNSATITSSDSSLGKLNIASYHLYLGIIGHGLMKLDYRAEKEGPGVTNCIAPHITGKENLNGDNCITAEMASTHTRSDGKNAIVTTKMWIAPDKGFAVPRVQTWVEGGDFSEKTLILDENTALRQYAGGIWGPSKCVFESYDITKAGSVEKTYQRTISYDPNFQINVPVSDSAFTRALPSGTTVTYEVSDATYTVP